MYSFTVHFSCVLFHRCCYGDTGTGELREKIGGVGCKNQGDLVKIFNTKTSCLLLRFSSVMK